MMINNGISSEYHGNFGKLQLQQHTQLNLVKDERHTSPPPQKKTMFEGYLRLTMDKIFRMISVMSGYSCSALKIRTPE
jgi:hypothetical protein